MRLMELTQSVMVFAARVVQGLACLGIDSGAFEHCVTSFGMVLGTLLVPAVVIPFAMLAVTMLAVSMMAGKGGKR
ncbi:hypothetical protein GCM10017767_21100 [Halomonas urumqiensis]|nr:hypothetical protein GCM10017767_21100 [Halomonas urumqiensis]